MRSTSLLAIVVVIIGVGSLLGSFIYQAYSVKPNGNASLQQSQYLPSQQPFGLGMMGGYGKGYGYSGMMGQGTTSAGQPATIQQAVQMMQNIPSYAKVISNNNTVVFDSQQFSVFVLALMPDKAENLTGRQLQVTRPMMFS